MRRIVSSAFLLEKLVDLAARRLFKSTHIIDFADILIREIFLIRLQISSKNSSMDSRAGICQHIFDLYAGRTLLECLNTTTQLCNSNH